MNNYCGADCGNCLMKDKCGGCVETCGSPFGGRCVAAEYIKTGGVEAYREFRKKLKAEINALLRSQGLPPADKLYELAGAYVNLVFTLPGGEKVKFMDDRNIYLGAQIKSEVPGLCCGVAADTSFILICSYGTDRTAPELILYKKR